MRTREYIKAHLISATVILAAASAFAGTVSWLSNPPTNNWNDPNNWSPATVPGPFAVRGNLIILAPPLVIQERELSDALALLDRLLGEMESA